MRRDQAESLRVKAATEQIRWKRPPGTSYCRVIAVTGGKGGVGKTNIAVNMSLALQKAGAQVLLLDADLGLANVDVMLGISPEFNLQHVVNRQATLEQILVEGPMGLNILPGGTGIPALANLNTLEVVRLLGSLRALERQHDVLVIDTAAGIGSQVTRFACASEEVIVVCTPEPPAMLDAYGLVKSLKSSDFGGNINLLVNMARNQAEITETTRSLTAVVERYLGTSMVPLGGLPRDDNIPRCIRKQIPFYVANPNSLASRQLDEIARFFLKGVAVRGPQKAEGFFGRLIAAMR